MRLPPALLALTLLSGCGNKVDHPDSAPACDPAVMDCRYTPPESGGVGIGDGNEGGAAGEVVADWSGQVLAFKDDFFDEGTVYPGVAEVSATGVSGARVQGSYDGTKFELKDVLKVASNWFFVKPNEGQGVLPTLTVVDTRTAKADALAIGMARLQDIDAIYQLSLSGEASTDRAQVVLRIVDPQGRSVPGVRAQFTAEVVAYRSEQTWDATEDAATDDSGMIFLGNVPATPTLSVANVVLLGSVSARIEIRILAGAVTVATVAVSPP